MVNETININPINNNEDFWRIINSCQGKFGNLVTVSVIGKDNNYLAHYGKEDLDNKTTVDINDVVKIQATFTDANGIIISVGIDKLSNTLTATEVNMDMFIKPTPVVEDPYIYFDDPNCQYFRFENNEYVKYDPNKYVYYVLKDGEWKVDYTVVTWMHDNNLAFEELPFLDNNRKV